MSKHLDQGVVDNAGDNVETVDDGEGDEQLVERRSHLGTPELKSLRVYYTTEFRHQTSSQDS